jgi:hypothetical protein
MLLYIFWTKMRDAKSSYMIFVIIMFLFYLSYNVINPQYFLWCLPFLLFLVLGRIVSKRSYFFTSFIPLIWMYFQYNALYFISPILIWNEGDYPPWSYITTQLRPPVVVSVAEALLTIFISLHILFFLSSYLKRELKFVGRKHRSSQEFS